MFAVGSLGSLLLGPLIGLVARRQAVQQTLRIPMIMALALAGAALALRLSP